MIAWLVQVRRAIEYAAVVGLVTLLRWLPLALTLRLCAAIKWVVYGAFARRRAIAVDNILAAGVTTTRSEAKRIARECFGSFVLMLVETAIARRRLTAENWSDFVTLELGEELQKIASDPDAGVIAASAHVGNWEIAARATSRVKPVSVVTRPLANPMLRRWVERSVAGFDLAHVSKHDADPLRFIRPLREGRVLALMTDQYAGRRGIPIDFFGRPAWTHKSIALLHLITGCPLVFAYALRTAPLRYTVKVVGPLRFPATGDKEADVARILERLTRELETVVRANPTQYMWGHRRWRSRSSATSTV